VLLLVTLVVLGPVIGSGRVGRQAEGYDGKAFGLSEFPT
jgi:hypothetical protein